MALKRPAKERFIKIKETIEQLLDIDICVVNNKCEIILDYSTKEKSCPKILNSRQRQSVCKKYLETILNSCEKENLKYKIYTCHINRSHMLFPIWYNGILIAAIVVVDWNENIEQKSDLKEIAL
ncbi:MAG: PocR ligand-binding domain-containing protein, partial [Tissierellia bacterium]|nr:PocR ligand-binding domain-containing protein [Tissierellia bacterium]